MSTGLAVTITECRPVFVDSASSEVKAFDFREVAPLKNRVERILNKISIAKSRKTADVVYTCVKNMILTFPVPDRPMQRTFPGVDMSRHSWAVRFRLKFGMRCRKSKSHLQLSSLVHFSMIYLFTFF